MLNLVFMIVSGRAHFRGIHLYCYPSNWLVTAQVLSHVVHYMDHLLQLSLVVDILLNWLNLDLEHQHKTKWLNRLFSSVKRIITQTFGLATLGKC